MSLTARVMVLPGRGQGTPFRDGLRQQLSACKRSSADTHRGDQRSGLLRRNAAGDGERVCNGCNADE